MKFKEIVEKCAQITSERPDKIVTLNAGRSIYLYQSTTRRKGESVKGMVSIDKTGKEKNTLYFLRQFK